MAQRKKKHSMERQLRLLNGLLLSLLLLVALITVVFLLRGRRSGEAPAPTPESVPASTFAPPSPTFAPTSAPESTPTPAPTPVPEPEYYTLSFIGDCTLAADTEKKSWGIGFNNVVGKDYAYPFSNTVQYFAGDYMTIGNLECCLSDRTYYSIEQFVFLSPAAYARLCHVDYLHPHASGMSPRDVLTAQLEGIGVNVWTVNDEETMRAYIAVGTHGIISNHPDVLHKLLK